jgi:hypothetical protein
MPPKNRFGEGVFIAEVVTGDTEIRGRGDAETRRRV